MKRALIDGLVCIGLMLLYSRSCGAEDGSPVVTPLLSRIDLKSSPLNPKQISAVAQIKKQKAYSGLEVVRLRKDGIAGLYAPLTIPVPKERTVTLTNYKISPTNGSFLLTGGTDSNPNSTTLILTKNSLSGLIYTGKGVYQVEPLGDGLHAIILLDQTKFGPDEPPEPQQKLESGQAP